jgi:dienelactone hydrolase
MRNYCLYMAGLALFFSVCVNESANAQTPAPALAADINEEVVRIPVIIDGKASDAHMVGTVYKPEGTGPFPFVVLNHGRAGTAVERAQVRRWRYTDASRWLVQQGFAVFVATRRGYGDTGGTDVEQNYNCANPWYAEAMAGGVQSVLSVIAYAKAQPFVDRNRFLVMGQSVGGYLSVGTGAAHPEGLVAVINFAGGHGGRPDRDPGNPCEAQKLKKVFEDAGKVSRVPALWVYTENDAYFGPTHTKEWHQAFTAAGGRADFRMLPPFGTDGHTLFVRGIKIWHPLVLEFLRSVGFEPAPIKSAL